MFARLILMANSFQPMFRRCSPCRSVSGVPQQLCVIPYSGFCSIVAATRRCLFATTLVGLNAYQLMSDFFRRKLEIHEAGINGVLWHARMLCGFRFLGEGDAASRFDGMPPAVLMALSASAPSEPTPDRMTATGSPVQVSAKDFKKTVITLGHP